MVELKQTFNAGASILSESLKPVKESVVSMLQLQTDNGQHKSRMSIDLEKVSRFTDNDHEQSPGSDKYLAPSTPQLKQGVRLVDDGDCQEQTNCSTVKESGEHDGESNSIETICGNLNAETECTPQPRKSKKIMVKEEEDFADRSKDESVVSPNPRNIKVLSNTDGNTKSPNKVGVLSNSCEIKANWKKVKVDWTPELHKKFVKAVEQLGIDQAIPSRILDLMKVEGLTRHNVASHLQMHADAWGCPVLPPPQAPCFSYSQNMPVFHNANEVDYKFCMPQSSFEHYPGHFLIKNSKYLVRAQDLLNEFCSLGTKQSDVVKQKSQKNKQWQKDNGSGPSMKHSLTSLEFVELQKRKTKLLSMLEEVYMFPNQSYIFRFI